MVQHEDGSPKTISLILPVYNVDKYLAVCLTSLSRQTFPDFEAICVDDGSTDRSGEILDEFAAGDSRFIVIHQKNQGVSVARNVALDVAKSEYIGFVDPDDYLHPQALELLYNTIRQNNTDIVACGYEITNQPFCREFQSFYCAEIVERYYTNPSLDFYTSRDVILPMLWNKLYKSELLRGIRFIPMKVAQDEVYLAEVMRRCQRLIHIDSRLYFWYQRVNSATKLPIDKETIDTYVFQVRKFFEMYQDTPKMLAYIKRVRLVSILAEMFNEITTLPLSCRYRMRLIAAREVRKLVREHVLDYQGLDFKEKYRLFRMYWGLK